jgi:hypothetical protein
MTDEPTDRPALSCQRCSAALKPGRGEFYLVKILALADPSPPVITREELAADVGREIQRLVAQLRGLSEAEMMDQVYRRELIYLCAPCYRAWIANPVGG